jgi:hypothetical protein
METEPNYCTRNGFHPFLQFMDRFLLVLKIDIVPTFKSLHAPTSPKHIDGLGVEHHPLHACVYNIIITNCE